MNQSETLLHRGKAQPRPQALEENRKDPGDEIGERPIWVLDFQDVFFYS